MIMGEAQRKKRAGIYFGQPGFIRHEEQVPDHTQPPADIPTAKPLEEVVSQNRALPPLRPMRQRGLRSTLFLMSLMAGLSVERNQR